jgi:hypothetical protein
MKIRNLFLQIISITSLLMLSACSSAKLEQNSWKPATISIDGNSSEWQNHLKQVSDQKVWLATANDEKYFYICLVLEERAKIMQMMRAGFTTWFIPSKNEENTFGIKYPLSNKALPREQVQNMTREMFQQGGIEKLAAMFIEKQKEIQILNGEKYSLSLLPLENSDGIRAKLGYTEGKLVYELQVPLAVHDDYAFQIAALPGENVKIKFETEAMDLSAMRSGGGEGMPSGSSGQMGGIRQGRSGGAGGGRFSIPEPFNYAVEVKLALPK